MAMPCSFCPPEVGDPTFLWNELPPPLQNYIMKNFGGEVEALCCGCTKKWITALRAGICVCYLGVPCFQSGALLFSPAVLIFSNGVSWSAVAWWCCGELPTHSLFCTKPARWGTMNARSRQKQNLYKFLLIPITDILFKC